MASQHVNQEMIDAYYEYTHLTLDRRKFASKLRQMTETEATPRSLLMESEWQEPRSDSELKLPQ
ncbi:hypothetical protein [Rhizobium sp. C1]|uniref:hypothetical protein n=1 Tax=Rhizobium sp. C1 TaxID=1349799 RepID=UPI001E3F1AC2|nr:hypothetical protein [Rhizobium sp. C1]MCD2179119.1 hypothetical protein [Rhizobium sp. C1]